MRKPISIFLVTSLLVAPLLGGACAPLTDLGGSDGDGGGDRQTSDGGNNFGDGGVGNTSTTANSSFLIYVMSEALELYSFNPTTNQFVDIAKTNCQGVPHSIAIDHNGNAYALSYADIQGSTDTWLEQLDLATGVCTSVSYAPNQQGFSIFGMAFSTNGGGTNETLYLQGAGNLGGTSGLATLDTTTFKLTVLPNTATPIYGGQLTGTADGRLFSLFYPVTDLGPVSFGQIDKTNGNPISQSVQSEIATSDFSVAYWGGDFYFFTSTGYTSPQVSTVTRYSATDGTFTNVATLGNAILLAAGVSTAAPQ
jgi:hypothetical protein